MIIFPGLVDEGAVNAFLSYKDAFVIAFIIYIFKQALGAGVATINNDEDDKK